jgi:hypothetical protein
MENLAIDKMAEEALEVVEHENIHSKLAVNQTNLSEDVWGMPKYEQNDDLANLTDEQYLARVSTIYILI